MEGLLTVLVIWGLYKLFFSSSKLAQAPIKKRRSSYTKSTTTSARSTKPSPSIKKSSYSEKYKKSPNYERTYSGPQFAQPGEKSKFFGYASFEGAHQLQGPFAIIDLETSGFNPPECKILEISPPCLYCSGKRVDKKTAFATLKEFKLRPLEPYVNSYTPILCKCLICHKSKKFKVTNVKASSHGCSH